MYFGAHVSAAGGVDTAADRAIDIGAEAVQLFIQSPRMWRPVNHRPDAIARFRERCDEGGIRSAVAHAIYLINVASSDTELYAKSVDALCRTMEIGERLGLDAVIFHPGSHRDAGFESCKTRLVAAIRKALRAADSTWLLLENSAGAGGTVGRSIEELAALIDGADRPERLGICIDTCHWYVSGVDVTDASTLDRELKRLDASIGLDRLRTLHVNDAKTPLGSNRDRHANIGEGELGEGLAMFLGHPRLQGRCAILEVPGEGHGPTAGELEKVRAMHARALRSHPRSRPAGTHS